MGRPCVWEELVGQRRAAGFLETAARSGAVSHAYLFVGPPGTGKRTAAIALACALLCDDEGCGACPTCYRIKKGFHPDVRVFVPEGAATYMIEQIRAIVRDVSLTPVQAERKVYIIEAADAFNEASANAFLKTLEEPPEDTVFVLLASRYEAVLPTVASRCQVVRFSRIPPSVAVDVLVERTGAQRDQASAARAAAGGALSRALEFVVSPSRRDARSRLLGVLKDLPVMDGHDVLSAGRALLASVKAPLEDLKALQAAEIREREEFLGARRGAGKSVEERHRRELTAREREGVLELLAIIESWLRDCLVLAEGAGELVVNSDAADTMDEIAMTMSAAAASRAIAAVRCARSRLAYNVSPQSALDALLFDIREVLKCPR